ncbi:hypothetical protein [Mediterraneibacter gnavus]|uniref:hypothetical protein n=1 Tax=Mediterraneibacter gnavus TaxID=33038 RepID=UPI0034A59DF3
MKFRLMRYDILQRKWISIPVKHPTKNLYQLRCHEKRGKQLIRDGVKMEQLELMEKEMEE